MGSLESKVRSGAGPRSEGASAPAPGVFCEERARGAGIRPSMATIMERALIWAEALFRVISGLRLAISQSRASDEALSSL
jgi:hypothetical protein